MNPFYKLDFMFFAGELAFTTEAALLNAEDTPVSLGRKLQMSLRAFSKVFPLCGVDISANPLKIL